MAVIKISAEELVQLVEDKDNGKISEVWKFLGERGDAYAYLASPIVSENVESLSIPGLFYQMVRWQWENSGVGEDRHIWGDDEFFEVGKLHLGNYLAFLSANKVSNGYLLPNTEQIEASYKDALTQFGLPPITAIDSLFSVIDYAFGNDNGAPPQDFSWAQFMNISNILMDGPEWEDDRIVFNSEVFINDIDPIEAVTSFGRTVFNTIETYGGGYIAILAGFAPAYWALKLVDETLDFNMVDFANYSAAKILLKKLNPSLSNENIDLILDHTDNNDRAAFGFLVDHLGKALGIEIPTSNSDSDETHLFENVKTIGDWLASSEMSFSIHPVDPDIALSKALGSGADALAYRYAIVELNSFVIEGDLGFYQQHNQNGELELENLSEQYLLDRAKMLAMKLLYGLTDTAYSSELNTGEVDGNWDYIDYNTLIEGEPLQIGEIKKNHCLDLVLIRCIQKNKFFRDCSFLFA